MKKNQNIEKSFAFAKERYAGIGVDVDRALKILATIPISLHCWQGDDVGGFENFGGTLGGGLVATGNYPGKARTPDELRADLEKAFSLIPGKHRLNLHAFYGEFGGKKVDRDEIAPEHFKNWIAWAKKNGLGLDFNPTCFSHPKAADGFTLSHRDQGIRKFWIEHCIRSREIGAAIGKALGKTCVTNVWIPDGMKDTPADRHAPRARLAESLDAIFKKPISPKLNLDAVEPKLFGIGSESYVVGSHEFYLGYAVSRKKLLTLDAGHYHPTEGIADKISSVLQYLPEILLHVSRGVRWDSDHVVILNDDLLAIAREIVANGFDKARPHRPRLFRREHQPRGGVDDRHAQHASRAADRAARTDRKPSRRRKRAAISPRASRCRRKSRRCRSARSGIFIANPKAFPSAKTGWPK